MYDVILFGSVERAASEWSAVSSWERNLVSSEETWEGAIQGQVFDRTFIWLNSIGPLSFMMELLQGRHAFFISSQVSTGQAKKLGNVLDWRLLSNFIEKFYFQYLSENVNEHRNGLCKPCVASILVDFQYLPIIK